MNDIITQSVIAEVSVPRHAYTLTLDGPTPYISMQMAMFKQKKLTEEYTASDYLIAGKRTMMLGFSEGDKKVIVNNANRIIRGNVKDLDPVIARLVNKNFKSLLWT